MAKANKDKVKILSDNLFPVVGIGASAGGLDAFKRLLMAIPEKSGMAYILVQHLDPAHESILSDILQEVTKIPVQEITNNIKVVVDHIYIIPSNKLLTATDGVLQLSDRPPKGYKNMPIDLFFESLADVHKNHAIGVVLSGLANDGTLGLKAIKEVGGITFAQDQQSAAYNSMPRSAEEAEVVDFILPPEKIPEQLLFLMKTFKISPESEKGFAEQIEEAGYEQVLSLILHRKGLDFTNYKQATIHRRITRRIALSMKTNLTEYLDYLKGNTAEQDILFQDLLIPVTAFFRDNEIFSKLCDTVLPTLLKDKADNEPLRLWIAGCSTGEEAYSMMMCLHEYIGNKATVSSINIFATDISEIAITKARSGLYSKSEVVGVSDARLQQFFTKTAGKFRINKIIRDSCVFATHNYLKDPPFSKIDLVSCRNSLIYLEHILQKKALTTFHYALREKGFLLLGKSETIAQATEMFTSFDKNSKIFTRKAVAGKFLHVMADRKDEIFKEHKNGFGKKESTKDDFQKAADDVLLSKFAPPGVIVNAELDIVQFRGATSLWLEQSSGKPSVNVLKLAREGLAFELRNALHKAEKSKQPVLKEAVPMQFMGMQRLVTIEVIPLANTVESHFLILFTDAAIAGNNGHDQLNETNAVIVTAKQNTEELRIVKLQEELAHTREDMRSITEDQETFNEELQSANEELLSGSEELQSLNEELETSKEEIQTTNEELIVVNQELFDRNEQLNLSRLYSESIVSTIREPLIILNKELGIRSANKAFYSKFQTAEEQTTGKSLFEIGNKQWNLPGLRKKLEQLLSKKTTLVDFEVAQNFSFLGERILLLNASPIVRDNDQEQSILLAMEDVTDKRKSAQELKLFSEELEKQVMQRTLSLHESNNELEHSNENLEQFAYIASHDLQEPLRKIRTFSSLLQERYDKDLPEAGKRLVEKIISSSERMSTLIKGVLNYSKILRGESAFEKTDLNDILEEVINDFDLLITEKNAVIYHDRLPVIEAVTMQINQLFYNLISNSLKFSKKDIAPVVNITTRLLKAAETKKYKRLDQKLSYCQICFKDNGIGFKQEYSGKIFLIFQRLHTRQEFSGTGIGLALCKTIVTNHHGEIEAISGKNKGAIFKIILPLKQ